MIHLASVLLHAIVAPHALVILKERVLCATDCHPEGATLFARLKDPCNPRSPAESPQGIRCRWVNTVTKDLWGSALFGLEYRCVLKLPCGLALEYNSYDFEWRTRPEGQRTDPDWTGTSYTSFPGDDLDLLYEILCKTGSNPNN